MFPGTPSAILAGSGTTERARPSTPPSRPLRRRGRTHARGSVPMSVTVARRILPSGPNAAAIPTGPCWDGIQRNTTVPASPPPETRPTYTLASSADWVQPVDARTDETAPGLRAFSKNCVAPERACFTKSPRRTSVTLGETCAKTDSGRARARKPLNNLRIAFSPFLKPALLEIQGQDDQGTLGKAAHARREKPPGGRRTHDPDGLRLRAATGRRARRNGRSAGRAGRPRRGVATTYDPDSGRLRRSRPPIRYCGETVTERRICGSPVRE